MNAQVKLEPDRFDAFRAYREEREWSRKLEERLSTALGLLRCEVAGRKLRGDLDGAERLSSVIQGLAV